MLRWLTFFMAIAVGIIGGLYYTWQISPVEYDNSSLDQLRTDYRADLVLMVAEAYARDGDLNLATRRLTPLGGGTSAGNVEQMLAFAERIGYAPSDLTRMRLLAGDLRRAAPLVEPRAPGAGAP
jgi:hypothetical protein